jgi:lysophospholipid acyltransferase (LPLAT)-like uncharacterized protein
MSDSTASVNREEQMREPGTGLVQRLKLWTVSELGYWVIRVVGATLRWTVEGQEHEASVLNSGRNIIYTFWHGRIFYGTWFFRERGIMVMTSRHGDGEYIARVVTRFGCRTARGSSTRGAKGALVEMARYMRQKKDAAFTIDGPRGPRYVAKPGSAWLASKTGSAILPFCAAAKRKWVLRSWDLFHIPCLFSPAVMIIGEPIWVPLDATESDFEAAQEKLQNSLEELLHRADTYWERDRSNPDSKII